MISRASLRYVKSTKCGFTLMYVVKIRVFYFQFPLLLFQATLGGHMKLSKKYTKSLEFKSADSLVFAPQKSLGTGLECSLFLIKDKALLSSLDYHFQEDISVDSTDKNSNCPKNVDSLKLWMLFKTRGISGVERMINTSFDCAKYCMDSILKRSGFRLVIPEFQYTNICFWYVPSKLRYRVENEEWWENIFEVSSLNHFNKRSTFNFHRFSRLPRISKSQWI